MDETVELEDGLINTTLYRKRTNSQQYLSLKSWHPRHSKLAILYSQALRCRRICSDDNDLDRKLDQLKGSFSKSGYPTQSVNDAMNKACAKDRKAILAAETSQNARQAPST